MTKEATKEKKATKAIDMKSNEFLYWLHGFFNISGAKSLNKAQTSAVKAQLEQVDTTQSQSRSANEFCKSLLGFFELSEPVTIDASTTEGIQNKLEVAIDAIDEIAVTPSVVQRVQSVERIEETSYDKYSTGHSSYSAPRRQPLRC